MVGFQELRNVQTRVLDVQESRPREMLRRDIRERQRAVNAADRNAWSALSSREEWERFLRPRISALESSLGRRPDTAGEAVPHVERVLAGDGFKVECLWFESRPGVRVAANLYLPDPQPDLAPGIVIVHSHHNPRTQGELQDMGMTWARAGSQVLVIDQLSYGERREHRDGSRQDYRFRYINGLKLYLIGDSLMGWMVWDLRRALDLLLARPGTDRNRIILIGAVAGGGDPAGVTAALDPRVTCVVPFNFGGPQPESPYPLPDDAEVSFDYLGGAYWESTRNLHNTAAGGFLHWVIVGSVAPRALIHAHEFNWDQERDPVWRRFQRIWGWNGAADRLGFAHGFGVLSGQPPAASHCNNVGPPHRAMMYPWLRKWFRMPEPQEFQARRAPEELAAVPVGSSWQASTPAASLEIERLGRERADAALRLLDALPAGCRTTWLQQRWSELLGGTEPPAVHPRGGVRVQVAGGTSERFVLNVERGIQVPAILLRPATAPGTRVPVVTAVCQQGKAAFLEARAAEIGALLGRGIAVCLADVRGTGETDPGGGRGFSSTASSLAASELALGGTLLGGRLRDLRAVLGYLRRRADLSPARQAIWGDSFAPFNPPGFADPLLGEDPSPHYAEPLGGLLAVLGAMFEDSVQAVVVRGGLVSFATCLAQVYCYLPLDAVVPGALPAGDLPAVAAALAPRYLRFEAMVDGRNCRLGDDEIRRELGPAVSAYRAHPGRLSASGGGPADAAEWLANAVAGD